MDVKEISKKKLQQKKDNLFNREIVLYNDDVNTFDHVIDTLIKVCNHSEIQAEQCAFIVHHKGKCTVKTDTLKKLIPICTQLLEAGLSAEIV